MTTARKRIVDPAITRWYHCISRCVRQLNLFNDDHPWRKQWLEDRLRQLSALFAISIGGYSVLDNHLHVMSRLDPDVAKRWSKEEVLRRWCKLYPPRGKNRKPLENIELFIKQNASKAEFVDMLRERLQSLSWFMKTLKEPLARMINKEDGTAGHVFDGRFKSIGVLDERALLATCIYIDLNPVAAGVYDLPEISRFTSIKERTEHFRKKLTPDDWKTIIASQSFSGEQSASLEDDLWLCPMDNRQGKGSTREGILDSMPVYVYACLVDYCGRLYREGKASIHPSIEHILNRLGVSVDQWNERFLELQGPQLRGQFFAFSKDRLNVAARQLERHHLSNLHGNLKGQLGA